MRPKRRICDRNGCDREATRHVTWPAVYDTGYFACSRHARWWIQYDMGGRSEVAR
jgi:hypothetical protein